VTYRNIKPPADNTKFPLHYLCNLQFMILYQAERLY